MGGQCHTPIVIPQKRNPEPIVQEAGWDPRASYTKYFNINHIHVVKEKYSCPCVHQKVIWWSGGIAQTILNLSTRCILSDQLQTPGTLPLSTVTTTWQTHGWAPHMVWMLWRTQKSLVPALNWTMTSQLSSLQSSHYNDYCIPTDHALPRYIYIYDQVNILKEKKVLVINVKSFANTGLCILQ
jgi:hypothetical protein